MTATERTQRAFAPWLAPSIILALLCGIGGWAVRVEVHLANMDCHHSLAALHTEFVQSAVQDEANKRIEGQLTDMDRKLTSIDEYLRGGKGTP